MAKKEVAEEMLGAQRKAYEHDDCNQHT